MWDETKKDALLKVCNEHCYQNSGNVIVPEPYLPYVPENWNGNGILVLAESQSSNAPHYWKWVKEKSELERMQRLGENPEKPEKIGIGPWDDGTIKLALQAIFTGANLDLKLEDVAVSNAVPWTRGSGNNSKNLRPDKQMEAEAAKFWMDIFDKWQPDIKVLVVLGSVAKRVLTGADILSNSKYKEKCLKLRLPSSNAINRVSGMFDCADLKKRFKEVEKALNTLEIIESENQYKMKVFFACHAVSLGVSKFKEWFGEVSNL
jgi:hypothetical protein